MPLKLHVCVQQRYAPNPLCCANKGSRALKESLAERVRASGIPVEIAESGCMGMCQSGPNLRLEPYGKVWSKVTPAGVDEIIEFLAQAGAGR